MMGYQAAESAPLVVGHPIDDPHTVATAIKIGNPASWNSAIAARDESGGIIDMVTDAEILAAYRLIAAQGIFAEPASAASVAGLIKFGGERRDQARIGGGLHADRPWTQGPGHGAEKSQQYDCGRTGYRAGS